MSLLLAAASTVVADEGPADRSSGDWTVKRWGAEDGLPVNSVNDLFQDEDGYLWLATFDGLVRFDGLDFEVFDAGSHPAMISDRILVVMAGRDGAVWMASEHARLMRLVDGRVATLDRDSGLPHERVVALERIDGRLWAGTEAGAARWNGERFRALADWREPTTAMTGDADGRVWLGSRNGRIARYADGALERLPPVDGRVWMLLDDPDHGLWIAHDAGLSLWRDGGYRPLPPPLATLVGRALRIARTRNGELLLDVAGTLYRYDGEALEALAERHNATGRERLAIHWPGQGMFRAGDRRSLNQGDATVFRAEAPINQLEVDRENNLWVATGGDGLYRLRDNPFVTFASEPALAGRPAYPIVAGGDGRMWVGTGGNGFAIVDGDGRVEPGTHGTGPIDVVYALLPPASAGQAAWVGGLGLYRYRDGRPDQAGIPERLREAEVRGLFRDRAGRIWAGTSYRGLWRREGGEWTRLALPGDLASARVRVFAQGAGDTLWMGTNGSGLVRYRDGEFARIGSERGLTSSLVRSLHLDGDGRLWVGTENRGLCRIADPAAAVGALAIDCLDRRDGLFDDGIHQILPDGRGHFWMSSNRGIFRVAVAGIDAVLDGDRARVRSTVFTEADGLPNREANGGVHSAGTVAPDGRLWFPTMDGPVVIDVADLPPLATADAVIEQVETRNEVFEATGSGLALPVGERDLTLHYAAPSYVDPAHTPFEYRLLGYDDQWRPAGFRRRIDFTNLEYGDYRFEVRALGNDGSPGTVAGIDLALPPRLVETAGFRTGLAALALLLLAIAWYARERRQRRDRDRLGRLVAERTGELQREKAESENARDQLARQAERLKALDAEKRAFFANISHELRTPLTLLLGPLEQAEAAPETLLDQVPLMQRNARRLNRLVEQILDLQRIEAGQMTVDPELHDLGQWVDRLAELFRPLARRQGIGFEVDTPADGIVAWFDAPQMEKVVGNLLSNAIKHCRSDERVAVRLERDRDEAVVRVDDTGPGIAPEHLPHLFDRFYRAEMPGSAIEGTGIGLSLARELALLHGGDLTVESNPGEGACFTLRWPAQAQAGRLSVEVGPAADSIETPPGAQPATQPADDAGERKQVMVVDDNRDLRAWLHHELRADFRLAEAEDGEQALARMRASLPDVVISDWMMPRLDGVGLIRRMRSDPTLAGVPVILLSARAEIGDQLDGLGAGALAYMPKPFNFDVLRAQVDSVLDLQLRLRRSLMEERFAHQGESGDVERTWMQSVEAIVAEHLHDPDFGVEQLAGEMNISRAALFRKLRDEADCSPSELLRKARLANARRLLRDNAGSVSEVAYAVGFHSLDGFSRAYRRCYGISPSRRSCAGAGKRPGRDD